MNAEAVSLRQSYVDSLIDVGREREDFVVLEADAGGATFIKVKHAIRIMRYDVARRRRKADLQCIEVEE